MKPIEFDGQNVVFAKDQPEYQPLPARVSNNPERTVTSCWELTDEELAIVMATKRIYCGMFTFGQPLQPLLLTVELPEE